MDKNEIQRVKGLSQDELLEELGRFVTDSTDYGQADLKLRALQWLDSKRGKLYEAICAPDRWPAVSKTLDSTNLDDVFTASWDKWLGDSFGGIPICTIVAVLVKEGLNVFCGIAK